MILSNLLLKHINYEQKTSTHIKWFSQISALNFSTYIFYHTYITVKLRYTPNFEPYDLSTQKIMLKYSSKFEPQFNPSLFSESMSENAKSMLLVQVALYVVLLNMFYFSNLFLDKRMESGLN